MYSVTLVIRITVSVLVESVGRVDHLEPPSGLPVKRFGMEVWNTAGEPSGESDVGGGKVGGIRMIDCCVQRQV
jgi:hypothetical protein